MNLTELWAALTEQTDACPWDNNLGKKSLKISSTVKFESTSSSHTLPPSPSQSSLILCFHLKIYCNSYTQYTVYLILYLLYMSSLLLACKDNRTEEAMRLLSTASLADVQYWDRVKYEVLFSFM